MPPSEQSDPARRGHLRAMVASCGVQTVIPVSQQRLDTRLSTTNAIPIYTTTILVDNLHCESCAGHIKSALEPFESNILDVSVVVLSQHVVITHTPDADAQPLAQALSNEAFEISSVTTVDQHGRVIRQLGFDEAATSWHQLTSLFCRSNDISSSQNPDDDVEEACVLRQDSEGKRKHAEYCFACCQGQERRHEDHIGGSCPPVAAHQSRKEPSSFSETPDHHRATSTTTQWPAMSEPIPPRVSSPLSPPMSWYMSLSIGGMTCASCTSAVTDAVKALNAVQSVHVDLMTNSGWIVFHGPQEIAQETVEAISDLGYEVKIMELRPSSGTVDKGTTKSMSKQLYRVTLSIEGMVCATCTSTISKGLLELDFVQGAKVVLVNNSGEVVFEGRSNLDKIIEWIQESGFDVLVQHIEEIGDSTSLIRSSQRTVQIKIDGMYCNHCPLRVSELLATHFGSEIAVEQQATLNVPVLNVTYKPRVPEFTIRDIIRLIDEGDTKWIASIYRPPSIEEQSKKIQEREKKRLLWRFLFTAVCAIPTLIIGPVAMMSMPDSSYLHQHLMDSMWKGGVQRGEWALLLIATPVYFIAASHFHVKSMKGLRAIWRRGSKTPYLRRFYRFGSMDLLITIGTSVAYFASLAILAIQASGIGTGDSYSSYFDSVVFLTFFTLLGRWLEVTSKAKTGEAISMLGQLRPDTARLVEHGSEVSADEKATPYQRARTVPAAFLEVGDTVIVPHGASPPADGVIIDGEGNFDESSLTGESRPIVKTKGETIYVGTINKGSPVVMDVSNVGGKSMLDDIVTVVREGLSKGAPVERLADAITGYFVPVVCLLAIITFATWTALGYTGALSMTYVQGQAGGWAFWSLRFAISVFVIACPCGIGLAAPMALYVGIGLAAKHGILVRGGGQAFQEAHELDAVVFDKTGTLTEGGDLSVTGYKNLTVDEEDTKVANSIALHLEGQSCHPIAAAVAAFLANKPTTTVEAKDVAEVPGCGLHGKFIRRGSAGTPDVLYEAAIGSLSYVTSLDPERLGTNSTTHETLLTWQSQAKSLAVLAMRLISPDAHAWSITALFGTSDSIRPSAEPTVRALQRKGLQVFMLSGDNANTACAVGRTLGIPASHVFAGVLPTEKAAKIEELKRTIPRRNAGRRSLLSRLFSHNERTSAQQTESVPSADACNASAQDGSSADDSLPIRKAPSASDLEKAVTVTSSAAEASSLARVAFVGDGINDAPALVAASVSVTLASGSSIALTSSSFVLLHSSLDGLPTLLGLSGRVMRRMRLNFGWAIAYNAILVPLAAGVAWKARAGGFQIPPQVAAGAMMASSLSVIASSLALRWEYGWKLWKAWQKDDQDTGVMERAAEVV